MHDWNFDCVVCDPYFDKYPLYNYIVGERTKNILLFTLPTIHSKPKILYLSLRPIRPRTRTACPRRLKVAIPNRDGILSYRGQRCPRRVWVVVSNAKVQDLKLVWVGARNQSVEARPRRVLVAVAKGGRRTSTEDKSYDLALVICQC